VITISLITPRVADVFASTVDPIVILHKVMWFDNMRVHEEAMIVQNPRQSVNRLDRTSLPSSVVFAAATSRY
jgi:hypothetical protein